MKLKNFLIESAYFLGMLIAMWLTVSSCAALGQDSVSVNVDWLALGNGVWMPLNVQTDTVYAYAQFGWVTDSIKWVVTDTTFEGDCKCEHDWVYGEPDIAGYGFATYSCLVYHPPGQHCDFNNDVREKICRHCLRSEIEREQWYQHLVAPPKSEFEKLKEKQRAKQ